MKMTRRDFLNVSTAAAVVCAATLLPVEKAAAAQQTLAAQNLLEQAYLYAFPLVIMDATRTASTNTRTATSNKAPINQFIHAEKLADATTRVVVTPNVDTIYTQAFLDVETPGISIENQGLYPGFLLLGTPMKTDSCLQKAECTSVKRDSCVSRHCGAYNGKLWNKRMF